MTNKVGLKGGSWYDIPESCQSVVRYSTYPDDRSDGDGFRLLFVRVKNDKDNG